MPQIDLTIPIYQQLMDEISSRIISGRLRPGQQLPSVRELAGDFQVNPNTIARAYRELERLGIVFTRRGQGTFVSEQENVLQALKQEKVRQVLGSFFAEMSGLGFSAEEALIKAREFSAKGGEENGIRSGS